jgi:hypothetical protein
MTTRSVDDEGSGGKLTALEQIRFVKQTRKRWAALSNAFLEKAGSSLRVDHRSYKARGIASEPTVHRGPNERERRDKREHARRVREEQKMAEPEPHEIHNHPPYRAREASPPEPVASPAKAEARDEHPGAGEDLTLERLEAHYNAEPEGPWYAQALERALAEHDPDGNALQRQPARVERPERDGQSYERSLRERAEAMPLSESEAEMFESVRNTPADARLVETLVLQERLRAILEEDRAERLRELPQHLRERFDALRDRQSRQRQHDHWWREVEDQAREPPQDHGERGR